MALILTTHLAKEVYKTNNNNKKKKKKQLFPEVSKYLSMMLIIIIHLSGKIPENFNPELVVLWRLDLKCFKPHIDNVMSIQKNTSQLIKINFALKKSHSCIFDI